MAPGYGVAVNPSLPSAARLELGPLLARSWSMLRAHPVIAAALGGAVLFSIASMLFGVGILATPWFVCEIFALQLAILTKRPTRRSVAWIRAGVFVLGMTGVVVAATWTAALGIGPDVSTADAARGPLPWPEAVGRVAMIASVTWISVGFIAPFQYAPLILIERGGTIGAAVLESAYLVRRGGAVRHWALAFFAHLLPLLPALIAAVVVARTFERAATPLGVLVGLPLLPFSIPLGQGLLTLAYVERRRELSEPRWTRREAKPPVALVTVMVALVLLPMTGVALVAVGALRPAPPSLGSAPSGSAILARRFDRPPPTLHVPSTTLAIEVEGSHLRIIASDDAALRVGGVGPIDRVRVRRIGDRYAIEAHADRWWHVVVDRAGIRTDDSVGDRLGRRMPPWGLAAIALAFALHALLLVRALEPLGEVRRLYGAPATDRPPLGDLRRARADAVRTAWRVSAVLAVPSALAFAAGVFAVLA